MKPESYAIAESVASRLLAKRLPLRKEHALPMVPEDIQGEERLSVALQACCYAEAMACEGHDAPTDASELGELVRRGLATEADCMALKAAQLREYFGLVRPFGRRLASEHAAYGTTKAAMDEYIVSVAMPRLAA